MIKKLLLSGLILFLIGSCTPTRIAVQIPSHYPSRHVIDTVPQIHQDRNECGPAALAMVLSYYGIKKRIHELRDDLKWDPEKGTTYNKILNFPFEKFGLTAIFEKQGSIERLVEYIAQNRPIIVAQWFNYDDKMKRGMGHFRVVIGYDHEKGEILVRDPAITMKGFSSLSYKVFLDLWDVSSSSAPIRPMVILIPEPRNEKDTIAQSPPFLLFGSKFVFQRKDLKTGKMSVRILLVKEKKEYEDKIAYLIDITGGAEEEYWLYDLNLIGYFRNGKPFETYSPSIKRFSWPLKVGKSWSFSYDIFNHQKGTITRGIINTLNVRGFTELNVKAGSFQTFEVFRKGETLNETYHYAPSIGMIIKKELRRDDGSGYIDELIEYMIPQK